MSSSTHLPRSAFACQFRSGSKSRSAVGMCTAARAAPTGLSTTTPLAEMPCSFIYRTRSYSVLLHATRLIQPPRLHGPRRPAPRSRRQGSQRLGKRAEATVDACGNMFPECVLPANRICAHHLLNRFFKITPTDEVPRLRHSVTKCWTARSQISGHADADDG